MAKHSEIIDREVGRERILAAASGRKGAIAITDEEVVFARAGWFSQKIDRYPRSALSSVRVLPAAGSEMLALWFGDKGSLSLLFDADVRTEVRRLAGLLEAQLGVQA